MTISDDLLIGLKPVCDAPSVKTESDIDYIFLPGIKVPVKNNIRIMDALLCPKEKDGYKTRLFLSESISECPTIAGKAANWQSQTILGRKWYVWSWQNVPQGIPLIQMLIEHLRALR